MPVSIATYAHGDYIIKNDVEYIDVHNLLPLFGKLAFKINTILVGDTGIGKSSAFAKFAKNKQIPIVTHWCSEDQRREHLVGHLTLEDNKTLYHLGPLPKAITLANSYGSCILLLEEINGLTPQSQKLLNSLTDWHREVQTDYSTFRLDPGAQLWVVGTMNSAAYGGVYALNDDFKSRFRLLPIAFVDAKREKEMVKELIKNIDSKLLDKVITLAEMTRQGSIEYSLSPRDVIDIIRDAQIVGLGEALRLQSGKFDGDDRASYIEWIKTTFPLEMIQQSK